MKEFRDYILYNRKLECESPTLSWDESRVVDTDCVDFALTLSGCRTTFRGRAVGVCNNVGEEELVGYGVMTTAKIFLHVCPSTRMDSLLGGTLFEELIRSYYVYYAVKPRVIWDTDVNQQLPNVV